MALPRGASSDAQVNVLPRLSVAELLQAPHRGEALVLERDRQRCHPARRLGHHVEALLEQPLNHRDRSTHRGKVERRVALGGAPGLHDGWALHQQPFGLIEVARLRGLEEALLERVHCRDQARADAQKRLCAVQGAEESGNNAWPVLGTLPEV